MFGSYIKREQDPLQPCGREEEVIEGTKEEWEKRVEKVPSV